MTYISDCIIAVTGWKSVFVNKGFTKRINGVTKDESDILLQYLFNVSLCTFRNRDSNTNLLCSSLLRTMMLKFATNGIKTTLLYGITGPTGIAQHTIMTILESVTEYVVLVKHHISI